MHPAVLKSLPEALAFGKECGGEAQLLLQAEKIQIPASAPAADRKSKPKAPA